MNVIKEDDKYISQGMHIMGKPEGEIIADEDKKTYNLLRNFLFSVVADNMNPKEEEVFTLGGNHPGYIIEHSENNKFEKDSPLHNPYGIWTLTEK